MTSSRLQLLRLELLRGCPLACRHCSVEAGPNRTEVMTNYHVQKLLTEGASLGADRVIFTGGEPLEYPSLLESASLAKSLGIKTILFTTGITRKGNTRVVDRSLLDRASRVIDSFVFSFYSDRPSIHDRITCIPGSWGNTRDAAMHIANNRVAIGFTFLPLNNNYADLLGVARLGQDVHAYEVRVLRLFRHGRAARGSSLTSPSPPDFLKILHQARREIPGLRIRVGGAAGIYGESEPCNAPASEIFVAVDGSASPCPASPTMPGDRYSNCIHQGLETVWRSNPIFACSRDLASQGLSCQKDGCLALRASTLYRAAIDPQALTAVNSVS